MDFKKNRTYTARKIIGPLDKRPSGMVHFRDIREMFFS